MRNFTRIMAIAIAVLMLVPMVISANPHYIIPNPPVDVPNVTPTIDGTIDEAEGWSAPAKFNDDTVGYFWRFNPLSTNMDVYFAYDETGIYYALDIVEGLDCFDERTGEDMSGLNSFVYSAESDWLDLDEQGNPTYGWDGDVACFVIDPLGGLMDQGFHSITDYTAMYAAGLFLNEDGTETVRMYRSRSMDATLNGEITDQVQAAGTKTEKGWRLEACIPWEIIATDTNNTSLGTLEFTAEDLYKYGGTHRASIYYQDRFIDESTEENATWGRYIIVPEELINGLGGQGGSGDDIMSFGLELNLVPAEEEFVPPVDIDPNAWYFEGVKYCMQKGYFSGNDKGEFMPNDPLTREQFVVVLAKLDGVDLSTYEGSDFADVPANHWAAKSIKWAAEMKYTSGTGNGNFGLGVQITREQLATFFYNYAKGTGKDVSGAADLTVFTDHADISGWATTGLAWAVDVKMITGTSATTVSPKVTANRATAARLFMLYDQNINK